MKYLHWFKGLVFIALACSVTAQGSTVQFTQSDDNTPGATPTVYQVAVSNGQSQNAQASANLTITGEKSKVSVTKEGVVSVVAGESIVFRPGTKISSGCFLYASIESKTATGKHKKTDVRLVTVEEKMKIEEQAALGMAYTLFSPFPSNHKGYLHAGDAENGSFNSLSTELCGVFPEQQRKVAIDSRQLPETSRTSLSVNYSQIRVAYVYRAEVMRVLRL